MAMGVRTVAMACGFAAVVLMVPVAEAADCRFLAHASLKADDLPYQTMKGIFLGEIRFVGQVRVVPFTFEEGSEAERLFVEGCLGLTAEAFRVHWVRLVFREGVPPPRQVESPRGMVAAIAATPGGVGYLPPDRGSAPNLPPEVRLLAE